MRRYNKITVNMWNGKGDEWGKDEYSHAIFNNDDTSFMVFKFDNRHSLTGWYNLDYVASIIIEECEGEE